MKRTRSPSRCSVRAAIAASLRRGDTTLQRTAGQLGVSPRWLQRRLAEMGTSFSELIADVRLDTACHLLVESDERIAKIAARLGFAGASSFNRSFMRLMKIQPGAYRRQQLSQTGSTGHGPERRRPLPAARD